LASAYAAAPPRKTMTMNASAPAWAVACIFGTVAKSEIVRASRCAPSATLVVVVPVIWRPLGL
jgi:hypothetical protein